MPTSIHTVPPSSKSSTVHHAATPESAAKAQSPRTHTSALRDRTDTSHAARLPRVCISFLNACSPSLVAPCARVPHSPRCLLPESQLRREREDHLGGDESHRGRAQVAWFQCLGSMQPKRVPTPPCSQKDLPPPPPCEGRSAPCHRQRRRRRPRGRRPRALTLCAQRGSGG